VRRLHEEERQLAASRGSHGMHRSSSGRHFGSLKWVFFPALLVLAALGANAKREVAALALPRQPRLDAS
jgi:hypothetical protein